MRDASASVVVIFFFSSRRRHTRFDCDWSSDVCSSDLHLLAAARGRLLLHLDDVGAFIAQQRDERALPEARFRGLGPVAHRDGEDLDAVLALPPDLHCAAEPGLARALRHADGDVEIARGERAELAAVGGVEIGRGDDENPTHEEKCGMRNVECGMYRRAASSAPPPPSIPHFASYTLPPFWPSALT